MPQSQILGDEKLVAIAADAARRIDWDTLREQPLSSAWRPRRRRHSTHQVAQQQSEAVIYTREHENPVTINDFAVLVKSVLPCSIQELQGIFDDTRSSEQLREKLTAVCGKEFVAARVVQHVSSSNSGDDRRATSKDTVAESMRSHRMTALAVNAVTFERPNLFKRRREEWMYLDITTDVSTSDRSAFTKIMVPLHGTDDPTGDSESSSSDSKSQLRLERLNSDVLVGFLFEDAQPERQGRQAQRTTQVWYYAEYSSSEDQDLKRALRRLQQGGMARIIKTRLVRIAEWTERLTLIVRRRRLGVQVLVDRAQVSPPPNRSCSGCKRLFLMNCKKVCSLCGYFVCEKCSAREVRETRSLVSAPGATEPARLERIRVCTKCMVRVDQCSYENISPDDLRPVEVVPDSLAESNNNGARESIGVVLTDLLQSALKDAPAARRASVMSVIKYLVDHKTQSPVERAMLLLAEGNKEQIGDQQYIAQVPFQLQDEPLVPHEQCKLATPERRNYALIHPENPAYGLLYPVPANEARRIEIINDKQLSALDSVPELDIICSLACQELQCVGATVSIVEDATVHVIATNFDFMENRVYPRSEGFCSRTILNAAPLLVSHPEADIRFSYMMSVKYFNASFYCGFPLFAEDFTVIGSLCCLGDKSRKLSQSQFTVLKKLAETASRVLQQRHAREGRRG